MDNNTDNTDFWLAAEYEWDTGYPGTTADKTMLDLDPLPPMSDTDAWRQILCMIS